MEYIKLEGDLAYRRVPVDSNRVPGFQPFDNKLRVTYEANEVLEVQREGENEPVVIPRSQIRVLIQIRDNVILIPTSVSLTRLWVVSREYPDVRYKIPDMLPEKNGYYEVMIPGGTDRVTLKGDRYFMAAYQLQ